MTGLKTAVTTTISVHRGDGLYLEFETRCESERADCRGENNVSNNFDATLVIDSLAKAYEKLSA